MSGYISGEAEAEGPPSMTTLPAACARSVMSWICWRLDVHAADHHDVGPFELGGGRLADILVDETDRPPFRHIGGDQQQALRRHEGAHPFHQPIGVVEGAEGGRVMRKNAQDPTSVLDWDRAAHATSDLSGPWSPPPGRDARGFCLGTHIKSGTVAASGSHCPLAPPGADMVRLSVPARSPFRIGCGIGPALAQSAPSAALRPGAAIR